ncbi:MAG: hypothetical protein QOE00_1388 [Ilumatobacteraceae bacterium]
MPSAPRHLQLDRIVGPFADLLLAAELPELPADRRSEAVRFVTRRADAVPSFTRFGLTIIAVAFRGLMIVPGGRTAARALAARSLPLLGEYPRLIRSLGFAFVWEHWPDTLPNGAPQ